MGKKILVVEDERNIVDILTFNLAREGYGTLEALDVYADRTQERREGTDGYVRGMMRR